MINSVTRRDFLSLLGAYGGTSALIQAGTALGLMPQPGQAAELSLARAGASGRRVAILGSGVSGLAVAWVDDDGNLQLRDDVYGRDVQLRDRFAFP